MHSLIYYLSFEGIASISRFVLKNQNGTYLVLVVILLALVMCLCWFVLWFIGKTRRGNELPQQQHAASAHLKERRLYTSRFESRQLKDERKVLDEMTTKLHCKNEEVEQIRDAHRKLKDSYGKLKDTLSECKVENCRLNERLNQKSYELEIKSKDLEKALIKVKNTQSILEKKQNSMAKMQKDLKQLQEELAKQQDEKWRLGETVQTTSEELHRSKHELYQQQMTLVKISDQFEQERQKHHTVIQNMECKIQKEKRELNVQLSDYKRKNKRLKDICSVNRSKSMQNAYQGDKKI